MANKNLNARIVLKHDIEENWLKAENFIPLIGEVIIYDADEAHSSPRIKVGDGENNINALPFVDETAVKTINGVGPDENGDVSIIPNIPYTFADANALIEGLLTWAGPGTIAEAAENLRNNGKHQVVIHRLIMSADGKSKDVLHTGSQLISLSDDGAIQRVYFGDNLRPVIFDGVQNKIYFDADWVAPQQIEIATEDEVLEEMALANMLPVITDSEGAILTDENNNILLI